MWIDNSSNFRDMFCMEISGHFAPFSFSINMNSDQFLNYFWNYPADRAGMINIDYYSKCGNVAVCKASWDLFEWKTTGRKQCSRMIWILFIISICLQQIIYDVCMRSSNMCFSFHEPVRAWEQLILRAIHHDNKIYGTPLKFNDKLNKYKKKKT